MSLLLSVANPAATSVWQLMPGEGRNFKRKGSSQLWNLEIVVWKCSCSIWLFFAHEILNYYLHAITWSSIYFLYMFSPNTNMHKGNVSIDLKLVPFSVASLCMLVFLDETFLFGKKTWYSLCRILTFNSPGNYCHVAYLLIFSLHSHLLSSLYDLFDKKVSFFTQHKSVKGRTINIWNYFFD